MNNAQASRPAQEPACDLALKSEIDMRLATTGMMDGDRFADFVAQQKRLGLVHGSRPLCRHLSPLVLSERRYRDLAGLAELVTAALERVASRAIVDDALARALDLSDDEQALAAIDPGYPQLLGVGRLDALVSGGEIRFIELNADSPAGIADPLLLARTLLALPHLAPLRERAGVRVCMPHLALLGALHEIYAAWGGRADLPTIAIVDWTTGDTAPEIQLLAQLFADAGHQTLFVDPSELVYDGRGRLLARGVAIDLVYRRVIVDELLARAGMQHALIRAYRDRAVCVANSFRTKALNKKTAFAVLDDPRYASLFTDAQRDAIAQTVPFTRRVAPGPVAWRDWRGDLLDLLIDQRASFVLKPNDAYGGKGVQLGWETSAADWRAALQRAAQEPMVAQERVEADTVRLPTFADRALTDENLNYDLCPFVFAGRTGGIMVRVSRTGISNVSAGGGVAGLLIADDAAAPGAPSGV